jgi:uncharacterized protein
MNNPVRNKAILLERMISHKSEILGFGVKRIGLFGSFVRNTADESSDVDLLIEFADGMKTFNNLVDLAYFLEDLFGRKVELITPKSISPYIGPEIYKELEYVIAA